MWPILACSIAAIAIIIERFWTLSKRAVTPQHLWEQIKQMVERHDFNQVNVGVIRDSSP